MKFYQINKKEKIMIPQDHNKLIVMELIIMDPIKKIHIKITIPVMVLDLTEEEQKGIKLMKIFSRCLKKCLEETMDKNLEKDHINQRNKI